MDYIEIPEIASIIEKEIACNLSPKRYAHSRSTSETAVKLAERFGEDRWAAHLAGLSHDMCRGLSFEEQNNLVNKHRACIAFLSERPSLAAILSDREYREKMIHGPAAACSLCYRFQVREESILEAVALHSIADDAMSPLAKIVYIADKLEPLRNRSADADEKMQTLDLDSLFAYTLASVVRWFSESGKPLCPYTAEIYIRMTKS
ncbi:MAG TPA: bis(5'-nucleosyl)-tetraphosphatase (symmetrical) YqeK [Rectinema sp.]|jgi:nicotinate-nucleotide adenylyltransferase|nr:bis(5'-nucleosyl)-tetraphosphatase (symmetrical) YqeK [Rectinema sp.]